MILPSPNKARRRSFPRYVLFLSTLILAAGGPASAPAAPELKLDDVISKFQARYQAVEDLETDFIQVTNYEGFDTAATFEGKVFLKKGRLRWDYHVPKRQQIFVEGDRVLLYVPEHQQVIKSNLSPEMDARVPVRLLAGSADLKKEFEIRWAPGAAQQEDIQPEERPLYALALTPRTQTQGLERVQIKLDAQDFLIHEIVLEEPGGNVSTFTFSGIRVNRGLKDALFDFEVPKGVVVVEQP